MELGASVAFLIVAGTLALVSGLIMLLTPRAFESFCRYCDRVVFTLDDKLQEYKYSSGIVMIMVAVWLFFMGLRYPRSASLLHPLWIIVLIFGSLYLFFPSWLTWLSGVANRNVLPVDRYVLGVCRLAGIILVLLSVYVFCGAHVLLRAF